MSREGALWIGGLENYMDEDFILKAMQSMGETNILSIKVIKNKFTGGAAGYGFINFISDQVALTCMHKLNGKMIPGTQPPVRFKLNHNSNRLLPGEKNHSIWVGDLTPEVDDLSLYRFFSARFQSIVSAKVVMDDTGSSKGFGFIRFNNETEQQTALTSMMGVSGLGGKPLKVRIHFQKTKKDNDDSFDIPQHLVQHVANSVIGGGNSQSSAYGYGQAPTASEQGQNADYYQQYSQYWSQYAAWQQWQQQYSAWQQHQEQQQPGQQPGEGGPQPPAPPPPDKAKAADPNNMLEGPLNQLVEHTRKIDVREENKKYLEANNELWDSMEESCWWDHSKVKA